MKHLNSLLLVLLAIIAFSCGKSEPDNTEPTPVPKPTDKIELATGTDPNPVIATDGGTLSVTFNTSTSWSAQAVNDRADAWCSVSPTSGNAGAATITITAKPNTEPDDRSASINIKAGTAQQTIKVTQKQKDALTVTASTFEVPAEGNDINIEVKANINVTYKIDRQCSDWIKYVSTKALKTSTLTFAVSKNESLDKREGRIIIGEGTLSDTIKIFQAGEAPSIVLNKDEYMAKSEGETFAIEVSSNVDVSYHIEYTYENGTINTDSENWLQESKTRTMSTNTYYFTAGTNENYDNRQARIVFTNKENNLSDTIKVTQLQKIAIILAKNEYEFGSWGGNLDFEVQTSVDVKVEISDNAKSWIVQIKAKALQTKSLCFKVASYSEDDNRQGTIKLSGGDVEQIITVKQSGLKEIMEKERAALIALYNATGGDNWTNNENWCSDKPVKEWYGINCTYDGILHGINLNNNNLTGNIPQEIKDLINLQSLQLSENNLSGTIPENISNLTNLEHLVLSDNNLSGSIPESITSLKTLIQLWLDKNQLTGTIPENIGNLINLRELYLNSNLLTGTIPESLSKLSELEALYLKSNKLSGNVPKVFYNWDFWKSWWWQSISGNNFKFEDLILPGPNATVECFNGKIIDFEEEYTRNKYTILLQWVHNDTYTKLILPELKSIYDSYSDKDIKIIGWTPSSFVNNSIEEAQYHIEQLGMLWDNFYLDENGKNMFGTLGHYYPGGPGDVASLTVVDTFGKIVFSDRFNTDIYNNDGYFIALLENDFKKAEFSGYETTDYSKDGEVNQLQKATKGKGIDIVLMGDAYSDRLIADGTYDKVMNTTMEKFFEEEPYKSFRDHFNVYSVTVVSKNEVYTPGASTALNCRIVKGSLIAGNDDRVFTYGLGTINRERMDDALFVVIMNSKEYAGTCYMYPPYSGTWGNGVSITYVPVGHNEESLAQVLHHEAGGHGFAKLADEYEGAATITNRNIEYYNDIGAYGWYKNIDFTSDSSKVKWSKFLYDERYANENLGIFEGGLGYFKKGVWRPTKYSIMVGNSGGFNAPSREAIYYRIHKLAYGPDWEYDYEKFVEWDAINRNDAPNPDAVSSQVLPLQPMEPLHPPVVVKMSLKKSISK